MPDRVVVCPGCGHEGDVNYKCSLTEYGTEWGTYQDDDWNSSDSDRNDSETNDYEYKCPECEYEYSCQEDVDDNTYERGTPEYEEACENAKENSESPVTQKNYYNL